MPRTQIYGQAREILASAILGKLLALNRFPGELKHEWADKIGPLLDLESNQSPSFRKFRDGIRRLVNTPQGDNTLAASF